MQVTVVCLIVDHLKVEKSLAETCVTKKETELEKTSFFFDQKIVTYLTKATPT